MSSEVKGVYLGDSSGQRVGSITREYKDEDGNDRLDIQIDKEAYEYIQQVLNHPVVSFKAKERDNITLEPVTLLGDQVPTVDWDRPAKSTPLADIQKAAEDSKKYTIPILQPHLPTREQLLRELKVELLQAHRERGESFIHLYPLVESAIHRERYSKFQKLVEGQSFEATVQTAMQAWNEALIELEKAGDMLAKEPKLKKFSYTDEDGTEIEIAHWGVRHIAASVIDSLSNAKNYITVELPFVDGSGYIDVIVQRRGHETPVEHLYHARRLIETIVKLCNDGKRVSFAEDTGGNTLTVSINARHSHVGTHECNTQELLDQLHGLLVEGRGLSWHDETEEYKESGQMALALKNRIESGDEITDEMRRQIGIMLICYEGLICQQFLPENRDNEPTPENPT